MNDSSITNPHDLFTRQSLSHLPTARSFIEHHLPAEVVDRLDLTTLTLRDGSYVDESLRESLTDLVFEVARRDEPGKVLVGVLFEHKSSPEKYIALQLLRYMINIWERQRREGEELLVVIPVVLYHGQVNWWAKNSMRELISAPDVLKNYIPDADMCLVDLSTIPDEELGDALRLRIMLVVLKHISHEALADRLTELMPLVKAVLTEEKSLQLLETLLRYLFAGTEQVKHGQLRKIVHEHLAQESKVMPTIAEELIAKGRKEGRKEGRNGLFLGIQTVVEQRFPQTASGVIDRIKTIDSLETLTRILQVAGQCDAVTELEEFVLASGF